MFSRTRLVLAAGLILYLVLSLAWLENGRPMIDEGWFANPALNLIQFGNFGTSSLTGVLGFDHVTFWTGPVYLVLLFLPVKLFGFHLWSVRLLGVVCDLLVVALCYLLSLELAASKMAAALAVLFLATDASFLFMARRARMEALTALLVAALLLCLVRASTSGRGRLYLGAGLISGIALLTHPIGVVCLPTCLVFVWPGIGAERSIDWRTVARRGLLVGGGFVLACLPYSVFIARESPAEFWRQLATYQVGGYQGAGLIKGPFAHLAFMAKTWADNSDWRVLIPKILVLAWLAWPATSVLCRKVMVAWYTNLLLILAYPNPYSNYMVAVVVPTAVVLAAAGKVSSIMLRPDSVAGSLRRLATPVAFWGMLACNLVANTYLLSKWRSNNVDDVLALVQTLVHRDHLGLHTVMGSPTYIFAFPKDEDHFRCYQVVGSNIKLKGIGWRRALADVSPDFIIVDNALRSGKWPAFVEYPCLKRFLSSHGKLLGGIDATGDRLQADTQEVYELHRVKVTSADRQGGEVSAVGQRANASPCD